MSAVATEEADHSSGDLQLRHIAVQVQTIDAFGGQGDVRGENVAEAEWYAHDRLRLTFCPKGPRRLTAQCGAGHESAPIVQPEPFHA